MKKVLLGLLVLLVTLNSSQAQDLTYHDYCFQILKTSEAIMNARQEGVDILEFWDAEQSEYASSRLVDAYSQHVYLDDEHKRRAEKEFAVKYYLGCMEDHS